MLRRWRIWAPFIIVIGYLSTLLLHAELGTYSRFIADDYCSAGMAQRFGILRAVWYWYLNWTGRYSASALDAGIRPSGPPRDSLCSSSRLDRLAWGLDLHRHRILEPVRRSRPARHRSSLRCPCCAVTLALSPSVPQSLYWGQGMRSIVPPLILSAVYADLALAFTAKRRTGEPIRALARA